MPALWTIPAGLPFVDALAAGLRHRLGEAPDALARATVLLPTQRACRSLREAFLRLTGGRPLLLPRMLALGELDEDELAFAGWENGAGLGGFDAPPALGGLRRQLLLTRLVMAFRRAEGITPDQAARLATELARLLDQVHTERLSFDRLAELAPADFADHWRITLDFLAILTAHWPSIVALEGGMDAAARRNLVLETQTLAWRRSPPADPVIVAGSTGTIPATADLIAVVASLPKGAVVLPGLDQDADEETWTALLNPTDPQPAHPQYGLARLLEHLGAERSQVAVWPAPGIVGGPRSRARLIERALRPADTAHAWREDWEPDLQSLTDVSWLDAPGPHEEALTIALLMRRTLEEPGRTAALVTPDRSLARRVAAELERWGIAVDDSAGLPLLSTPPGAFLRLVARMVTERLAPVPLLAALKHPLAAGRMAPGRFRRLVRELERHALRGPRPGPDLEGLRRAVAGDELEDLLRVLETAIRPFSRLLDSGPVPLRELLRAHVAMAEFLATTGDEAGPARLWAGEAGEAAAALVAELADSADLLPPLPAISYPALFETLAGPRVVRPRWGRHPRLAIWGLLEARLQHADVMILGGLNEGTWPPSAPANPWMSRPMMSRFGLPPPERRIGLTAHDFTQAFCADRVVLSRAARVEGTPTVPSRWLLRLDNLIRGTVLENTLARANDLLHWQRLLDQPETMLPPVRPAPRPPVSARPRKMSVSRVETWMRDPYGLYARQILRLTALKPLDADPGASDYGTVMHAALDAFVKEFPSGSLPAHALDRLLRLGREAFGGFLDRPGVLAFWWPRFQRVATWFVNWENQRRANVDSSVTEITGEWTFPVAGGQFTLLATADRIDRMKDGSLMIIDYKTGVLPKVKEVAAGYAPQLPLEAAIAEAGKFGGLSGPVTALEYWRLTGADPAGKHQSAGKDIRDLIDRAVEGLRELVTAFDFEETPYEARPLPEAAPRYSDYEHLARIKEWAAAGEDE